MKENDKWYEFLKSGSVLSYLSYVASKQKSGSENKNENTNTGSGNKRDQYR